jgi:hypothetical protein
MKKSIDPMGDASFVLGPQFFEESQDAVWRPSPVRPILECVDQSQTLETRAEETISRQLLSERQCVRSLYVHRGRTTRAVADALASRYLAPGGVVPGLPAVVEGSVLDLLMQGQWGNAFMLAAAGFIFPVHPNIPAGTIPITPASIDKIVAWDASVANDQTTLQHYAQVIVDLLHLLTGRSLIGGIITAHHRCKGISSLVFTKSTTSARVNASKCDWFDYPEACKINLEWYHDI